MSAQVRHVMSASEFLAAYRKANNSEPRPLVADINQREIDALLARKEFTSGSTTGIPETAETVSPQSSPAETLAAR